jgi:hypothetical protein
MATTYTTNAGLQKPAVADRNWNVPLNANTDALDGMTAVGSLCGTTNETPSTTLTLKVSAGAYVKSDNSVGVYAGGTIALTTASVNYVWLTGTGTLTIGSAFPTTPHVRICAATAGATTITSIADARFPQPLVGI